MRIEHTRRLHAAGILPTPAPTQDVEALGARLDALRLGFAAEALTDLLTAAVNRSVNDSAANPNRNASSRAPSASTS